MSAVAIGIGSNLGDRRAAIEFAVRQLAPFFSSLHVSTIIETCPVGEGLQDQPLYLNAVVAGETGLGARELIETLLAIERAWGRERPYPGAPRTLDLDLLLVGDTVLSEPGLEVPHPRLRERFFVLGPLAEIAPEMIDPVTGLRPGQLLSRLLRDETR